MFKTHPSFLVLFLCFCFAFWNCSEEIHENPVSFQSIPGNPMTHPLQVLASIDSAQEAGAISDFRAQMLRATVYYNPLQEDAKAIECARDALSMNSEELTDRNRILLLKLLGDSYYLSGDYEESLNAAIEGEHVASLIDSLPAQGEFRFIAGECMLKLGQYSSAFANMEYGIAALSKGKGQHVQSTLSHLLGQEMNFMIEEGRFEDAIATGHRRENLLDNLAKESPNSNYLDQQYGYLYGKMAFLFMKAGNREKASMYASKFDNTDYSKDPNGRLRILEYCLEAGDYRRVLDIIGPSDFPSPGDTMSIDGQYYLELKAEAMNGLGESGKAYSLLKRSMIISDTLDRNIDKERALKVSATYRAHQAEMKAKEAEAKKTRYLLYLIAIITACIIMGLGFIIYYNKTKSILDKNRLIKIGRTDTEKYVRLLQSAQAKIRELDPKGTVEDKMSETYSCQLFLKLEDAMDKDKLYLDKMLTRADILELLGISKNRLGKMFQDIGGDLSLPSYINGKRLNHALGVIAEHPDYTVNEIADASGFSNTRNFHLLFKKRFGLTPLQYRNGK